jgi:hypothetical protein
MQEGSVLLTLNGTLVTRSPYLDVMYSNEVLEVPRLERGSRYRLRCVIMTTMLVARTIMYTLLLLLLLLQRTNQNLHWLYRLRPLHRHYQLRACPRTSTEVVVPKQRTAQIMHIYPSLTGTTIRFRPQLMATL